MKKAKYEPGIIYLVRVVLMFNLVTTGLVTTVFTAALVYEGITAPKPDSEVVLDVRLRGVDTTSANITFETPYHFKQSKTGDLTVMLPWYTQLALPLGFLNIGGFEFSVPYMVFYFSICFLLYRVVASISMKGPFLDKNVKRIFWIGYAMIIYDAYVFIRSLCLGMYVEYLTNDAYRYDGFSQFPYVKFGIVVIIIAMVYRRGVTMQREQELTI